MKIVETFDTLQEALLRLKRPLGFVPTMGYLHAGHLSLVKRAKQDCESVVVSIFANPAQFAPDEDLDNYPRDIDRDLELTKPLEGQVRNTHFRGVTTVVSKLFNAVRPDKSYFGQKDAQQVVVIKQMVRDLNYPIEIVICPTIREVDGLAMSSRNSYLNEEERQAALCLSRGLSKAEEAFHKGEKNAEKLREIVANVINEEQLAELQYVSCAHPEILEELEGEIESCLLSMAVFIGRTRLIDNILLLQPKT